MESGLPHELQLSDVGDAARVPSKRIVHGVAELTASFVELADQVLPFAIKVVPARFVVRGPVPVLRGVIGGTGIDPVDEDRVRVSVVPRQAHGSIDVAVGFIGAHRREHGDARRHEAVDDVSQEDVSRRLLPDRSGTSKASRLRERFAKTRPAALTIVVTPCASFRTNGPFWKSDPARAVASRALVSGARATKSAQALTDLRLFELER